MKIGPWAPARRPRWKGEIASVRDHQRQVTTIRQCKGALILAYFVANLYRPIPSPQLHAMFGSSFRSRLSELNRDPAVPIIVRNKIEILNGSEHSTYTAEPRPPAQLGLFSNSRKAAN